MAKKSGVRNEEFYYYRIHVLDSGHGQRGKRGAATFDAKRLK